jgi:predicted ATPase
MIKSIKLENFFSFGASDPIELNQNTNILLGINGSGKSNLLKAIRFLYESIAGNGLEKIFLKDWGGFNAVANFSETQAETIKITYEFDKEVINKVINDKGFHFPKNPIYEITIHKSGATSYYLEESLSCESLTKGKTPFLFLHMKNGKGKISTREKGIIGIQNYPRQGYDILFKEQELVLRQISEPDRFFPLYTLKLAIETISVYDYFDTTLKSPIRMPVGYGTDTKLLSSGENLVQILHRIKNNHSLQFEKIEELLKNVNLNFKDINFDVLGSKFTLALREKNLAKTVSVEHISDGTLRFLLLMAILFNPERGCLVCIDEPEIGLHPDMINMIADSIKQASTSSQLIIATHSPLLLNSFNLEDCLIFDKNLTNETLISRKTEDDFPDWDDDFLVGQLWLSGKIGAKRW